MAEFSRVLNADGYLVLTCPDQKSVCALVAEDKLTDTADESPSGPIAPVDILYGHRPTLGAGNLFMANRCGFTQKMLHGTLRAFGFARIAIISRAVPYFELWAFATKSPRTDAQMMNLARLHFPAKI